MKSLLFILTAFIIAGCFPEGEGGLKNLKDLAWEKRIILVREDSDSGLRQLREATDELNERDVIWFRLEGEDVKTNYVDKLDKSFAKNLTADYFEKLDKNVFLIGKDGGIKSKDDRLDLKAYFGLIDSMPMRQEEMKKNEKR
jgi:hypothetical protein